MIEALVLAAAVFGAAIVAGFAGFAFSLLASGVLFHLREPAAASVLLLAYSVMTQAVSFARLRLKPQWPILLPLVLPALLGIPLGLSLAGRLDSDVVKGALGVFLILFSLVMAVDLRPLSLGRAGPALDGAIGFVGGVTGGFLGISGALPTAWVLMRDWPDHVRRMAYQYYIAIIQVSALVVALATTPMAPTFARDMAIGVPAAGAGVVLGVGLYRKSSAPLVRRLVLVLLAFSGASLLVS